MTTQKRRGGLTLTTKFMAGLGIMLLCVVTVVSFFTYYYLKSMFIKEAYEKTDIVLGHIDATMEYVRDELRPQVFHALPGDKFIREVMSSSFVNVGIMRRFIGKFPRYIYRRVALNPMNPADKANPFEEGFIKRFRNDPSAVTEWRGLVNKEGQDYFVHLKAIVMEEQCLLCHGDPAASPESITLHYGRVRGRHWKLGEIVGIESIAAPVSETFRQLRQVALSLFLFGIVGVAILFAALNYFHYRLAVLPLKRVSAFFREVVDGHRGLDAHFDPRDYEEVAELSESFNRMMGYLKESEEEGRAMEERLRQADKLASIGQLSAGVAHEINNPLSLVLGYTKMLRKDCSPGSQMCEDLDVVYQNATVCKKIVEDLLNFSHRKKAQRNPTEIQGVLDESIGSLRDMLRMARIEVVREYAPSLPMIPADAVQLKRLFANLITNAVQAMESDGRITIKTRFEEARSGIVITFSDTGPGVPAEIRSRIFEPFFTTKPPGEGTGLGLAVSYGIVREHGGEISVDGEKGGGALFTIFLPLEGETG